LVPGRRRFIFQPKRKLKLQVPVSFKVRHGYPEKRDDSLIRVIDLLPDFPPVIS
jgi:hypothetical protein